MHVGRRNKKLSINWNWLDLQLPTHAGPVAATKVERCLVRRDRRHDNARKVGSVQISDREIALAGTGNPKLRVTSWA